MRSYVHEGLCPWLVMSVPVQDGPITNKLPLNPIQNPVERNEQNLLPKP